MLGCPLSWFSRKYLVLVGYKGVNNPTCFLVELSISVPALTWTLICTEIIWTNLVPPLRLGTWGREGCGTPTFHPACPSSVWGSVQLSCLRRVLEAVLLPGCWEQPVCASASCPRLSWRVPGEAKCHKFLIKAQLSSEFAFSLMFSPCCSLVGIALFTLLSVWVRLKQVGLCPSVPSARLNLPGRWSFHNWVSISGLVMSWWKNL